MGGLLGKAPVVNDIEIHGAPQMIQLSLDGKRLYVTTSLFSTWDNQFYPDIKDKGGQMFIIDCDVENGGMTLREDFLVDFGTARLAHTRRVIPVGIVLPISGFKRLFKNTDFAPAKHSSRLLCNIPR